MQPKNWIFTVPLRLRSLFRQRQADQELDDELRDHVELKTEEYVSKGMAAQEARRMALLDMGGIEKRKEQCRDTRHVNWLQDLLHDLRYGLRMLRKSSGFTAVAILTLAVGIGANTAIFSVVDAVLLRPLAVQEPSRVVYVSETWRDISPGLSIGNFVEVRTQASSFESLCASNSASFNLATDDMPERVDGEYATASYFTTFGVPPMAGRVFTAEEDQPGHDQVVVISERLWRTRLHANPAVVGHLLTINGLRYTVVGIMPASFDPLLSLSELWLPEAFTPQKLADYDSHYLNVMGRLKRGVALAQAQSELNLIATRLLTEHPIDDKERGLRAIPLSTALLGNQKLALRMLLAAVGFVLLIACANIANLQLGRSRTRHKEIAVRVALGASPQRIVRQLLVENILLGLAGGTIGVLLAYWGLAWIVVYGPAEVPRLAESRIDAMALAFACGVALLASFLFGLAPALRAASLQLSEAFKEAGRTASGSRDRVRSGLVVSEVALALVLMAGAGLLIRSALLVSHVDPGFATSNLVVGRVGLPTAEYHAPEQASQAFERMVAEVDRLPGVESAAVVSRVPLAGGGGDNNNGLLPEGKALDPANLVLARLQIVSSAYLSTVRIRLKVGRGFRPQDTRERTLVAVVNETLARTVWPGQDPIGKRFACCEAGPKGRMDPVWHEVVGVIADVHSWGLDRQIQPEFFLPIAQMPPGAWDWIGRTMDIVVRTRNRALPARDLQAAVAAVTPGVPVYELSTMEHKVAGTLQRSQFDTFLLSIFAATALLLSSVGIYGLLSYMVAQRTRDIGIRMTLGATQGQILLQVLGYGARLTAIGLAVGLAGALAATRVLSSMLFGVGSTDAITFAGVSLLVAGVAFVATFIPARRAMQVDPMVALRYE